MERREDNHNTETPHGDETADRAEAAQSDESALRLVKCTNCEAKFGLPESTLAEAGEENPQLHCSRCDSLFLLNENEFFGTEYEYISSEDFSPLEQSDKEAQEDKQLNEESTEYSEEVDIEEGDAVKIQSTQPESDESDSLEPEPTEAESRRSRPTIEYSEEQETLISELENLPLHNSAETFEEQKPPVQRETTIEETDDLEEELEEQLFSLRGRPTVEISSYSQADLFSSDEYLKKDSCANQDNADEDSVNVDNVEFEKDKEVDEHSPFQMSISDYVEEDETTEEPPLEEHDTNQEQEEEESEEDPPEEDTAAGSTLIDLAMGEETLGDDTLSETSVSESFKTQEVGRGTAATHVSFDGSEFERTELQLDEEEFATSHIPFENDPTINSGVTSLFFASPLIGFVLLLFGFGEYLVSDFSARESFEQVVSSDLPTTPPKDLYLESLKFKKHTLISGEEVYSVDARLVNNSELHFKASEIEGILFDNAGKVLTRKKLSIGRPIERKSEIPNVKTLLTLQDQQSRVENSIASLEKRLVRIYFSSHEANEAKFFTARLYSATKS